MKKVLMILALALVTMYGHAFKIGKINNKSDEVVFVTDSGPGTGKIVWAYKGSTKPLSPADEANLTISRHPLQFPFLHVIDAGKVFGPFEIHGKANVKIAQVAKLLAADVDSLEILPDGTVTADGKAL